MNCVTASLKMTERLSMQVSCRPSLPAEHNLQLPSLKRDHKYIQNINTSNDSLLPLFATTSTGLLVILWQPMLSRSAHAETTNLKETNK
jgi:hypothetical protein